MFLKALLASLALFAGGAGVLRVSVLLESYLLLVGGVLLSLAAVFVAYEATHRAERVKG